MNGKRTLRGDFLSCFDDRMRDRMIEFGKSLQQLDADYIFALPRKAACLVDCLQRLNLTSISGIVTSERVLDMPTSWLRGKRVAIVDDALISGTSIFRATQALQKAGAEVIATKVVCVNKEWWNPDLCQPDEPYEILTNAATESFCASLVRALSLFPRPYAVDYPIFGGLRVPVRDIKDVGRVFGWTTNDTTNIIQSSHGVINLVAEPSSSIKCELDRKLAWPVSKYASIIKVRFYGRILHSSVGMRSIVVFRVMPLVAFDPLPQEVVNALWESLVGGSDLATTMRIDNAFGDKVIPKLRYIQYFIACKLVDLWLKSFRNATPVNMLFKHELSDILTTFPPPIVDDLLSICDDDKTNLAGVSSKIQHIKQESDNELPCVIPQCQNPWYAQARLLEPFLGMYDLREIPARKVVQKLGRSALESSEYQELIDRLRVGVSLPDLRKRVASSGDGRSPTKAVSAFLDISIDRGFVVPITVECNGAVYRAYRHGEDIKDSVQLRRLAAEVIRAFLRVAGVEGIPKTWAEKLLVLLVKLLVYKGVTDPSDSKLGAGGTVGVRFAKHGAVLKREVSTLYAVHDQRHYIKLLVDSNYLELCDKGYCVSSTYLNDPYVGEQQILAENIGSAIGMLYHPGKANKEKAAKGTLARLELFDLVLLASCANARDTAGALAAELELYKFHWDALRSHLEFPITSKGYAKGVLTRLRKSTPFKVVNNGKAKFVGYKSDEPSSIISNIEQYYNKKKSTTANRLLWRGLWSPGWEQKSTDNSSEFQTLVDSEGILLLIINILFRMLEDLCFRVDATAHQEKKGNKTKSLSDRGPGDIKDELNDYIEMIKPFLGDENAEWGEIINRACELRDNPDISDEDIRQVQTWILGRLEYCCHVARSILAEVDGVSAHYGITPSVDKFQHALKVEICGSDIETICDLNIEFERLVNEVRIRAKKRKAKISIDPICDDGLACDDGARSWKLVFAKGVNSRAVLIELAVMINEDILESCGGQAILFLDIAEPDRPQIAGIGSVFRNENFRDRVDAILKICKIKPGIINVFSPQMNFNKKHLAREVKGLSGKDLRLHVIKQDIVVESPIPLAFVRTVISRRTQFQETGMYKKANVGVISVIPNESTAIVERLKQFPTYLKSFESRFYHAAEIGGMDGVVHRLAMTSAINQGPTSIMPTCYHMLDRFDPELLILVGVGGSISEFVHLGDVCIADQTIDYMTGKEVEGGEIKNTGRTYDIGGWLRPLVNEYFRSNGGEPAELTCNGKEFSLYFCPIGTGNLVIGNKLSKVRDWLKNFNYKVAVVETEAGGISEVDYQKDLSPRHPRLRGVMIVRGISDHADEKKDDDTQTIAAANAFEAVISLLGEMPSLVKLPEFQGEMFDNNSGSEDE